MKRNIDETYDQFGYRLYKNKEIYNLTNLQIADILNLECNMSKAESTHRGHFEPYVKGYDLGLSKTIDNCSKEVFEKHQQIKMDLQKVRDENSSLNEKLRALSRKDNILELIQIAVEKVIPLEVPLLIEREYSDTIFIGGVADSHFGKEFKINGFNNEVLNIYNEDIFYLRMWNMLEEYITVINEEKINKVHFFDLGDAIEGILRISSLQSIKYGIVESTVKYAQFMATWLNELSKYVDVDYYGTLGNHSEIRPLGTKAGEFAKENMEVIITELLKAYLQNNENVIIKGNSSIQYVNIDGFKVLATHGQNEGNLISSVNSYKDIYNVKIDLMISGHLHNSKMETASLNTKVIQFPSIIGIDDYSMKLKKTAKAEGKIILKKGNKLVNIDIEL